MESLRTGKVCAHCLKSAERDNIRLLPCSACKKVAYCGVACQRAHWKTSHKKECGRLMEKIDDEEEPNNKEERDCASSTRSSSQGHGVSSPLISYKTKKEKESLVDHKECANCSSTRSTEGDALHVCTRCKAVYYCGKPCQIQHWRHGGHKVFCVPVEARSVSLLDTSSGDEEEGQSKCPICFEEQHPDDSMTLPCKHSFHGECVRRLRRYGIQQICPLCRTELPPGPEQVFVESAHRYVALERRLQTSGRTWQHLDKGETKEAAEIAEALQRAAKEGCAAAQNLLGCMNAGGQGVRHNYEEAVRWYRKAADQGFAIG